MKKINNSVDNFDDTDELRKKKLKTDVVTDQMVPVPENSPLRKEEEEREEIESMNDVKNDEFHSLTSKQYGAALETTDLQNASSMYEDVNSPEDFDDYDDEDAEGCCNAVETAEVSKVDYEPDNCKEEYEPDNSKEEYEPDNSKEEYEPDNSKEEYEPDNSKKEYELDSSKEDNEPDSCKENHEQESCKENHEQESCKETYEQERCKENYEQERCKENYEQERCKENYEQESCKEDYEQDNCKEDYEQDNCKEDYEPDCSKEEYEPDCSKEEYEPDNSKEEYEPDNYVTPETATTFVVKEIPVNYNVEEVSGHYEAVSAQETYIAEECSLPSSDVDLTCRETSPVTETAPTVCSTASGEEDIDAETEEQEEVEGDTDAMEYTFNAEEEGVNEAVDSNENFVETSEERGIVPEVEDVTCDSGGDTVLVMKHEVCSEKCDVSKPNLCTVEEMTYTGQLSSVEGIHDSIFHRRNTVIDSGNLSASFHATGNSVINCRDHLVCELPQRQTAGVVRYRDDYEEMGVSSVFPKRVCNSVCISSVPACSDRELYVYDPSVQNMFCRNSTIIDARSLPVNTNLNGLETYSFHRVPFESSSGVKNVNDMYGHASTGLCPVLQESRFEFDNRDVKPVKKLPTEEDFMRSIEKTLFESKIETKIESTVDSKYKSELDLSLPLKKRLRTLAAISNITCTPEKFVSPKEESFPSYPAKPMISIAALADQERLSKYQDSYK